MKLNTYAADAARAQIAAKQKASAAKPKTTKLMPTIRTGPAPTTKPRTSTRAGDKLKARLTTTKGAGNHSDDIQKAVVPVGIR